jgi:hypothetical protein
MSINDLFLDGYRGGGKRIISLIISKLSKVLYTFDAIEIYILNFKLNINI